MESMVFRTLMKPSGFAFGFFFLLVSSILNTVDPSASMSSLHVLSSYIAPKSSLYFSASGFCPCVHSFGHVATFCTCIHDLILCLCRLFLGPRQFVVLVSILPRVGLLITSKFCILTLLGCAS